ncbi:MAG: PEP/pyruvate-binding domain-containing protein, partial [Elusimicrobiales bacterium]
MELSGVELFERLMPKRIKKILLVASIYDSFLFADDEMLSEVLFEHNLTHKDHFVITRAKNPTEALELLGKEDFDMVISMMQSVEFDMEEFVVKIKNLKNIPVVILSFSMPDINLLTDKAKSVVDGVFLWQGDTKIFSSIINLIEDRINLKHDLNYGVQCVLLVEDNIRFYSMYLPIIYRELIKQMHLVMSDELNISKKVLKMKARPKIFLA